jgi:hypothetical protein
VTTRCLGTPTQWQCPQVHPIQGWGGGGRKEGGGPRAEGGRQRQGCIARASVDCWKHPLPQHTPTHEQPPRAAQSTPTPIRTQRQIVAGARPRRPPRQRRAVGVYMHGGLIRNSESNPDSRAGRGGGGDRTSSASSTTHPQRPSDSLHVEWWGGADQGRVASRVRKGGRGHHQANRCSTRPHPFKKTTPTPAPPPPSPSLLNPAQGAPRRWAGETLHAKYCCQAHRPAMHSAAMRGTKGIRDRIPAADQSRWLNSQNPLLTSSPPPLNTKISPAITTILARPRLPLP